jgi:hypothetical protein
VVDTDDMTPNFPDRFWRLWNDVYGLEDFTVSPLRSMPFAGLPRYLPLFQSRHLRRARVFDAPIVALRLFDIVGRRKDRTYAPRYKSGLELRAAYKLRPDSQILLVGVDEDAPLEQFWAEHQVHKVGKAIARLGVLGVTVPNFSYFTCVPRFQILRNRKRILLSAERLSGAGVPISIHINANCQGDWDFWKDFMLDHPEVSVITMEFQTGTRLNEQVGREAFGELIALRDKIGRQIHPLLVGGGRYYRQAEANFGSFTVIDSQPFMQALARQVFAPDETGHFRWKSQPTARGAPIDDLLELTLRFYEEKLLAAENNGALISREDPNQLSLDGIISTPYLTAQPHERGISERNSGAISSSQAV